MFDRPNLTIEQKQARARLSQRAGRLMFTPTMKALSRDFSRLTEFQQAVEAGGGFDALPKKFQDMILTAEKERERGDHE
jgi:hypothetical protein